jgi:methylphosphotriester-DNA--protein-cysteine methyltransferase
MIEKACRLLEQEQPLTLDELAQQVAMSWNVNKICSRAWWHIG